MKIEKKLRTSIIKSCVNSRLKRYKKASFCCFSVFVSVLLVFAYTQSTKVDFGTFPFYQIFVLVALLGLFFGFYSIYKMNTFNAEEIEEEVSSRLAIRGM
jgi:H+/Cl- antiporter ClcA